MSRQLSYAEYYNMPGLSFRPGDEVAVKIVAVVGYEGDWSAYAGLSDWSDEEVASSGDKIRQGAAEKLFPTLAAMFIWRD